MKLKFGALAVLAGLIVSVAAFMPGRGANAAVQELTLSEACVNGQLEVMFIWPTGPLVPVQQWLDLSLFDNGWQPGTFLGAGPIAPAIEERITWPGLMQNTLHHVRVNQQRPDGSWDPSATFFFTTSTCAGGSGPTSPKLPAVPDDRKRVLAPIESLELTNASGHYAINAKVGLPGGCAQQGNFEVSQAGTDIKISIYDTVPIASTVCTAIYGIYTTTVDLPSNLVPGQTYRVDVNGNVLTFTV